MQTITIPRFIHQLENGRARVLDYGPNGEHLHNPIVAAEISLGITLDDLIEVASQVLASKKPTEVQVSDFVSTEPLEPNDQIQDFEPNEKKRQRLTPQQLAYTRLSSIPALKNISRDDQRNFLCWWLGIDPLGSLNELSSTEVTQLSERLAKVSNEGIAEQFALFRLEVKA
jgi:hypothetical protein